MYTLASSTCRLLSIYIVYTTSGHEFGIKKNMNFF
jgi:hypothetical protein